MIGASYDSWKAYDPAEERAGKIDSPIDSVKERDMAKCQPRGFDGRKRSVYLPLDLVAELQATALKPDRSESWVIQMALRMSLRRIREGLADLREAGRLP